ncbi:MAG: type II toxin-antitoxin system RatA family toxin [Nitrososphaera sp.]
MFAISASREVPAPLNRVWEIVADIDNEPKHWRGLSSVRNISRNGNVIEREVTVGAMNFRSLQTVVLNPKRSVETTMKEGVMTGSRTITLSPLEGGRTQVDVSWDIEMPGIPSLFKGNVKNGIAKGTEGALDSIVRTVQ